MKPLKLGITGGIGSGKSYVAGRLKAWNVPVYNTDTEARRLMTTSDSIRRGLVSLLGEDAYAADGMLNKHKIAAYLFASASHAAQINRLVHPVVREDFLEWVNRQSCPLVGMECAILYESGFDSLVDKVLLVRASEETCLRRAMQRDGATESQVRARMAAQLSDRERSDRADYVIDNDGAGNMEDALKKLLQQMAHDARIKIKLF